MRNKYTRVIRTKKARLINGVLEVELDVYDVLEAFLVKCPALQHLIKKALCVGIRGHKDSTEDLGDILKSSKRAINLERLRVK